MSDARKIARDLAKELTGQTPEPITAKELLAKDLPPVEWAVPDILPAGVSLLAGKPKLGKSWLALSLAEAIAAGGVALGVKHVEQGDTLYLALEDNHRRLQSRLKKILGFEDAPEGMYFHTEWKRLDDGGLEDLEAWIEAHPKTRFICIDTLKKIRPRPSGNNRSVYDLDYEALEGLLPIAAKYNVSILVVHHTRKAAGADPIDEISGSFGLTGGVDGFLIMRRDRSGKGVTLDVDGRDVEEPKEYALTRNLNTGTWTIEGDAAEVRVTNERAEILLVIRRNGAPMKPAQIADALQKNRSTVRRLLQEMRMEGQIVSDNGSYSIPNEQHEQHEQGERNEQREQASPLQQVFTPVHDEHNSMNRKNGEKPDTYQENGDSVRAVHAVHEDLTPEEQVAVERLMYQGMSRKFATAEVLGVRP